MTRAGWIDTTLGEVAEIISGATPKTSVSEYWDGGIPWVTPKDLSELDGMFIGKTPRTLSDLGLKSCGASLLPANSVLLSSRAPIGHVAINTVPVATNQGFKSLVPDPSRMEAKFLYWWLRCNRQRIEAMGNGATFKEISKKITASISVSLPSLEEQKRIASILDTADELRTKRQQAIDQLDTLTQAIFHDMFGAERSALDVWPNVTLGDLTAATRPICYGVLKPGPFCEGGVPLVRIKDLVDGEIGAELHLISPQLDDEFRRSRLQGGEVLLSIQGTIGRVALCPPELAGANISRTIALIAPDDRVHRRYLAEWLRSLRGRFETSDSTRDSLNIGTIRKMMVPAPPPSLQQEFVEGVASLEETRAVHCRALSQLDTLSASLQQRAFRGDL